MCFVFSLLEQCWSRCNGSLWCQYRKRYTYFVDSWHYDHLMTPARDPQNRCFVCKPAWEMMEDKSMTKNHGGGIIGGAIIEKESSRRETSAKHLGSIWEASGRHLGLQEAMGLPENQCPSRLEWKSSIKMLIWHSIFEDQITKYCKLQTKMLSGSINGAPHISRPLIQHR